MSRTYKILPRYGFLTFTSFILCAFSGVFLAFVYNPIEPELSISRLLLLNPYASIIRAVHYWSAQLFFVLSIIHIIDHLLKSRDIKLKKSVWLRTVLTIPAILFVMLSGFFLRGDAESSQAILIFDTIIKSIPLIGNLLSYFLTGLGDNLIIIYIHHIVTTTILIWLFSSEHSKVIFSDRTSYLWIIPIILLLSVLLIPGLHLQSIPILKSPWYFIGLQEFLHWFNVPILSILIFLFFIIIIFYYPFLDGYKKKLSAYLLIILASTYLIFSLTGLFFRGENWQFGFDWKNFSSQFNFNNVNTYTNIPDSLNNGTIRIINGKAEGCLSCHKEVQGLSTSHSPDSIGCSSCHLGNPYTLNKVEAHRDMLLLPGNLSQSKRSCGAYGCHIGVPDRIENSLMNTMSGVISVDKWVFGESNNLDSNFSHKNLQHSAADKHLRALCVGCHISAIKKFPAPIDESSRGGGCSACHLQYSDNAKLELADLESGDKFITKYHPSVTINIDNNACFGCHSRSGRISTNYEGWHETLLSEQDYNSFADKNNFRLLSDGRVFTKMPEDIHSQLGIECIDCHTSYEIMGDGRLYNHKEEQVKIECNDCHFTSAPKTIQFERMDGESQRIINLRNLFSSDRKYILQSRAMMPLVNVYLSKNGNPVMKAKNRDTVFALKSPSRQCSENIPGHKRLSCQACHTAWTTQCIGCHTEFKENETGWDNLTDKPTNGAWIETAVENRADLPALGIIIKHDYDGKKFEEITTFVPGMIMTLKKDSKKSSSFHRLYAPVFSHTITKESRSCKSCHNNPSALGFGRGKLIYILESGKVSLRFIPDYPLSKYDQLPQDAWLGFLSERKTNSTTRLYTRPFNLEEQKRILNIGACLYCHKETELKIKRIFKNFTDYRSKLSKKCLLPF